MRGLNFFQARTVVYQGRRVRPEPLQAWFSYASGLWFYESETVPKRVVTNADFGAQEFLRSDWTDEDWNVTTPPITCPAGYHYDANVAACVPDTSGNVCPVGQHWNGLACVPNGGTTVCPPGYQLIGSACVPVPPSDKTKTGGGGTTSGGGPGTPPGGGGQQWGVVFPILPGGDTGGGGKAPVILPRPPRPPGGGQKPGQNPQVPPGGGAPTVTVTFNKSDITVLDGSPNPYAPCFMSAPTMANVTMTASAAGGPPGIGSVRFKLTGMPDTTMEPFASGMVVGHLFSNVPVTAAGSLTATVEYTAPGGMAYSESKTLMLNPLCSTGGSS